MTKPRCILCGKRPTQMGIFIPDRPELGRLRAAPYWLCDGHRLGPMTLVLIENELLRRFRRAARNDCK